MDLKNNVDDQRAYLKNNLENINIVIGALVKYEFDFIFVISTFLNSTLSKLFNFFLACFNIPTE